MMPPIIGIAGPAGAGKSYIANLLQDEHGYRKESFALPIHRMLVAIYGHEAAEFKKKADLDGFTSRHLMQTLGDWGRNLREDYWILQAEKRMGFVRQFNGADTRFAFDDVRFDNEADWVRSNGGQVWRISGVAYTGDHNSERGITPHRADKVFYQPDYWGQDEMLKGSLKEALGQ